jgi:hypothetical protein
MTVSKELEIHVQPGWRAGTKITFPQEGTLIHSSISCLVRMNFLLLFFN